MKVPWESWSIVYIVLHIYFVSRYISVSSGKDGDHEGERDDLELDDDEGSLQARLHPGLGLAHRAAARHPRLEQRLQRHHHRQESRTLHAGLSFFQMGEISWSDHAAAIFMRLNICDKY